MEKEVGFSMFVNTEDFEVSFLGIQNGIIKGI